MFPRLSASLNFSKQCQTRAFLVFSYMTVSTFSILKNLEKSNFNEFKLVLLLVNKNEALEKINFFLQNLVTKEINEIFKSILTHTTMNSLARLKSKQVPTFF